MKTFYTILVIAVIAFVGAAIGFNLNQSEPPLKGVTVGNEYVSTTTAPGMALFPVLKTNGGSLGSVVITKAGAAGGSFYLYDATTTNPVKRTIRATTTLASFPSNATAGTYIFDTTFNDGLLLEYNSFMGTSTITWR